ncbi:MAG: hypothetical protein FWD62_10550 [Betaproteobacteria bacterium]|nr:hypothetical protein [Betaproteobacteria bacterium]
MSSDNNANDPLEFMKNMWGKMGFAIPGMVTPTLDVEELERRITDLRAVEGWLRMNLNMLQATIQGLDVQRSTLAAVKAMSESMRAAPGDAQRNADAPTMNPFDPALLWPWNFVQSAQAAKPDAPETPENKTPSRKPRKNPDQ